jgi:predicted TIM-barrel fold metal-dependent hydrolase
MIVDLHVHIAGADERKNGNYWNPRNRRNLFLRQIMGEFGVQPGGMRDPEVDRAVREKLLSLVSGSDIDLAVVLALDGAFTEDGRFDCVKTRMRVDNNYVAGMAENHPKVLFGASVHPYRKDAVAELERLIRRGACLVKWIPSTQSIDPLDPKCIPFYETLAHYGIPLLSHTGREHALSGGTQVFNDPRRLVPALERGTTVIAAHCGTRVFLHERDYFDAWCRMAQDYEFCYGDLSAFICPTRMKPLRILLKSPPLLAKVMYGSDFPVKAMPSACLFALGTKRVRELRRVDNPLDRSFHTLQSFGLPDAVFDRALAILRTPRRKTAAGGER